MTVTTTAPILPAADAADAHADGDPAGGLAPHDRPAEPAPAAPTAGSGRRPSRRGDRATHVFRTLSRGLVAEFGPA